MPQHTVKTFDEDLEQLARKIGEMGRLVQKQVADAVDALTECDVRIAQMVLTADDVIDAIQHEIEGKAVLTIARRQPMAIDLREIVGALRISNDLERVGDLAENIAKRTLQAGGSLRLNQVMDGVGRMAKLVLDQLDQVINSYIYHDVAKALEVWRNDQQVDAINNSLFRELLTYMMEDPRSITYCTHLLFCIKNLERMGDHATNIAEIVYYIVEGHSLQDERPKVDTTRIVPNEGARDRPQGALGERPE
jgi:phosphate transport system protein